MGMTMAEKILANHSEEEVLNPGQFVFASVDLLLANDITGPLAIQEFRKIGIDKVFDRGKIALIPDHFTPNKDIDSARQSKVMKDFAVEQEIVHYYEVGRCGIEHVFLPEQKLVQPGDLVVGGDSHTCTYGALGAFATGMGSTDIASGMATGKIWFRVPETLKLTLEGTPAQFTSGKDLMLFVLGQIGVSGARYMAMEFQGETVKNLSMEGRLSMANMGIEAGAKTALFEPDQKTFEYLDVKAFNKDEMTKLRSDVDAVYANAHHFNVSGLEPQVALPHLPSNVKSVHEVGEIYIDQVVIGSCTNGRIEDLRRAGAIIRNHKVADHVKLIVIPGSQKVYLQAMEEGILQDMVKAGAAISTPTCGPCLGGHMGVLAPKEKALVTFNRNFIGRMGHSESEVYLAGPETAAASALTGKITHPAEVI